MSSPYIISASRREDIPSSPERIKWFFNGLKEGKFLMQGFHQNYEINLDKLKFIVFWTKNPKPFLKYLNKIHYDYYFQFTLNHYPEYELNIPSLDERIKTFKELSDIIGTKCIVWRHDPIIINDILDFKIITSRIKYIGDKLYPYTEKLVFSYIDPYRKLKDQFKEIDNQTKIKIAEELLKFNKTWNLKLATCAEGINLEGIEHNKCVDPELIRSICGNQKWITETKDKNQRLECGCISSADIGTFKTCHHNCQYCYAK